MLRCGPAEFAQAAGRRPRVPLAKVVPALVFHFMSGAGTLAEHFGQLFEDELCDSSLSERRSRLPWEVFRELMRLGLRALAQRASHPQAFWRGWRLLALDGTQFSLTNTPQIRATTRRPKAAGSAAFAKITTGVLLELGLHNPLAAAIGREGQSEWALACNCWRPCPPRRCCWRIDCTAVPPSSRQPKRCAPKLAAIFWFARAPKSGYKRCSASTTAAAWCVCGATKGQSAHHR